MAGELDALNAERREIEARVLAQAIDAGRERRSPRAAASSSPARAGIPASSASSRAGCKERYNRPACVVAVEGAIGKGSGRSVPASRSGPAIIAARQAGLLINGGGHAMAAGFTVAAARLGALRDFLAERAGRGRSGEALLVPELAHRRRAGAGARRRRDFAGARRAPRPVRHRQCRAALRARQSARGASRCRRAGSMCAASSPMAPAQARIKAIAFRCARERAGPALCSTANGRGFHVAGHLRPDSWQGREDVQLAHRRRRTRGVITPASVLSTPGPRRAANPCGGSRPLVARIDLGALGLAAGRPAAADFPRQPGRQAEVPGRDAASPHSPRPCSHSAVYLIYQVNYLVYQIHSTWYKRAEKPATPREEVLG